MRGTPGGAEDSAGLGDQQRDAQRGRGFKSGDADGRGACLVTVSGCQRLMMVGLTKYSIEQARKHKVTRARQVSLGLLLFHLFCSVGVLGWGAGLFMSGALGFWLLCGHWLLEDVGE